MPKFLYITVFLIALSGDMHGQRGISQIYKYASNDFGGYSFVYGELAGYSENDKKTIRRQNYIYLKKIIELAKKDNTCLNFPGKTLQIHLQPGDKIEVLDQEIVCLVGVHQKSKLEIFPKNLIRGATASIFNMKDGGSINLQNIHFLGSNNFARIECYHGILNIGGDKTKVKIPDTTRVRMGFWSNLVGNKVGVKQSTSNTIARTYTISNFDSTTRLITLSSPIDLNVASDFSDAGTTLGFTWGNDNISTDTITKYSKFFLIQETTSAHDFITGNIGELNFSKKAFVKISNCKIELFRVGIYISGGWVDYFIDKTYLQGDEIALTKYNGTGYGNLSTVYLDQCELTKSGKQLFANALTPYNTQNDNLLYGSGSYNHPNTRVVVKNSFIHDNLTGAFRQFSDGSEKSSPDFFASIFTGCTFSNNAEYHLLTSNTHRTVIENCTFENGQINLCFSTDLINSSLINSDVILYSYANAQPKPDTDTTQLRINLAGSKFWKSSKFSNNWSNSRSARTVLNFTNCDWELWPISSYYSQKITTGNYSKVNIENANVFSRFSEDYPNVISLTSKGTLLQGFIHYGNDVKIYANNIQYDTFRNSIPIIPTGRDNYISGKISNSRLLGIDGGFSQTGSNWGLSFENVEYPYTYHNITTSYNFKSGGGSIGRVSIGSNNIGSVVNNSIWLTSQASTYFINNTDTLKNVLWGSNVVTTATDSQKRLWSGFSGTITLIADTTFCIAPGGNIKIDSPVCYQKGDIIKLTRYPFAIISSNNLDRDSIIANGVKTNFTPSGNAISTSYQPGQTKVYVNNTIVGTDNYNEKIMGATVYGFAAYFTDRFNISFASPPASGSYVIVERKNATQGVWKID